MMKKLQIMMMVVLMMVSSAYAVFDTPGQVPQYLVTNGAFYYGANDQEFSDLGMTVRLEFAVYEGENATDVIDAIGYTGEATNYVYAYQVFCEAPSLDSLTYFGLSREDETALGSDELGIFQFADSFGGVEPAGDGGYFDDDETPTEAIWEFEDGALMEGDHSWYLFLFSDHAPVIGNFTLEEASADDDIPVTPEPATLVLLLGGSLLCFKRRK